MARTGPPRRPALPELIWDGKYDAQGERTVVVAPEPLPALHVAERYGVSPGIRAAAWRNRIVLGENRLALHALLGELRGQVQLIYIDPPFEVGSDFQVSLRAPGATGPAQRGLAYRDKWGEGGRSYLQMMHARLVPLRDLLGDSGCLFLHCDWHNSATLRLMLDEVFGRDRFVNEIVWHYYNKYSGGKACLPRAHDTILLYAKSARFAVNALRLQREAPQRQLVRKAVGGVLKNAKGPDGKVLYRVVTDKKADDVWDLPQLQPASPHWTGYGTQKHHDLLARIIALGSQPGDLVLDAFCGSGTSLIAAETLGRRWVGCDLGLPAIHITRRRLWAMPSARFDLYTLGSAERAALVKSFPTRTAFVAQALGCLGAKAAGKDTSIDGVLGRQRVIVSREAEDATWEALSEAAKRAKATVRRPLLYAAWGFAPGVWDGLDGLGLADTVVPILLPRAWLGPVDGMDAPCLPLPRLQVTVDAATAARGEIAFTLADWLAPRLQAGKQVSARSGSGLEDVDAWAVQSGWERGEAFIPQAMAFRSKRHPLAMRLTVPQAARGSVLIKAWDGFGREGTAVLPLPSGQRARGKARRKKS